MRSRRRTLPPPMLAVALQLSVALAGCEAAGSNPPEEPAPSDPDPSGRPPSLRTLAERVADADAVFVGTAVRVAYGKSEPDAPGRWGLPHTFVTYAVEQAVYGAEPGDELTLRFLGGPADDGRILSASHVPWIDVGDRDLLLVRGNGRAACPLVGCADGRFRLVGEAVYSETGRPVAVDPAGRVRLGARRDLAGFDDVDVAGDRLVRASSEPALAEPDFHAAPSAGRVDIDTLLDRLGDAARAARGPDFAARSPSAQDVDPAEPFTVKRPSRPAFGLLPPVPPASPADAVDAEEAAEIEAIARNGGDPVLHR